MRYKMSIEELFNCIDVEVNARTGNKAVVTSDNLDFTSSIINRHGIVVKSDQSGFSTGDMKIPTAKFYLEVFERYGDKDFREVEED